MLSWYVMNLVKIRATWQISKALDNPFRGKVNTLRREREKKKYPEYPHHSWAAHALC
jgi:hypothetical protein